MHEIAIRAGVGKATVSLALRDDPRLRPETRRRIQRLAAKMGYRTNATVANLMAQLRASRSPKYQATLGLLNASSDPTALTGPRPLPGWAKGCHERAAQLGYGLQPYWLHEPGLSAARLAAALESRNVRGLAIAAMPEGCALPEQFKPIWRRFACVAVGRQPAWPQFSFSCNDHYSTALEAVLRLAGCGYRRMGLVLSPEIDALAGRRLSAGFWAGQEEVEGCERIPTFPFHRSREASFRAWYARQRPDVIVCVHEEVKTWLEEMGVNIPGETGLVHLDRHEGLRDWAGMDQNAALAGAAAIDMLVGQLHRNGAGLPEFPNTMLVRSSWIDGATIARRASRRRAARGRLETVAA